MENNPTIFIRPHLGLGDMLVSNAIFRHFAKTHGLIIPCKAHNLTSVRWMLSDLTPSPVFVVTNDEQANRLLGVAAKRGVEVLRLGMFANSSFNEKQWDKEFYRVAGIPFEKRWSDWKVERDLSREFEPPNNDYIFLHDDWQRGFVIDREKLPLNPYFVTPLNFKTDNIFDYCRLIENATEIHVIDSCFAILADSLPNLKAKRKVVHVYSRPNALPPTYKQNWEILR